MITAGSRVVLPDGTYEVVGEPEDFTHGPHPQDAHDVLPPYTVLVETRTLGTEDRNGNRAETWEPEPLDVYGWAPTSTREPKVAGADQVVVDVELFVPPRLVVNLRRVA